MPTIHDDRPTSAGGTPTIGSGITTNNSGNVNIILDVIGIPNSTRPVSPVSVVEVFPPSCR